MENILNKKRLRRVTKRRKAIVFSEAVIVTLLLIASAFIAVVPSTMSENLPPKLITGTASKCDGGSAAGASVVVSASGYPSEYATVTSGGYWQVDIGPDSGTEWPDGTPFTVTITLGSFVGTGGGTVSGSVTDVGNIVLYPPPPTAEAGGPYTGDTTNPICFTGSATGGASPYTWLWAFGDGGTSTEQNPCHTYSVCGGYTATLTVTDSCGQQDSDTASVNVACPLGCSANGPYSGTICEPVSFVGSATAGVPPYQWHWAFGDGGTSTQQSPTHQYASDGSYTATLTVTDSTADTCVDTASVTISTPPVTANAGGSYQGTICAPVSFIGSASGGCTPYSWSWAFGDGGTSTQQNPTHQYASDGSYTATLTVTDSKGQTDTDTASVTISTPPVVANAGGSYSGNVGQPISFSGFASGGCTPYSWSWMFGDGGTSTQQNPTHTYTAQGDYTATLTVTDSKGQTASDTAPVHVTAAPLNANADGPYEGTVGIPIEFFGSAIGGVPPYSWQWEFGDGQISIEQHPAHAYDDTGTFTVTLTVTDSIGGSASDFSTATVYSSEQVVANAGGPYDGEAGEPVQFSGSATGGTEPYSWYWEFGDDDTSTEQNPSHTYTVEGEYDVTLTVTDSNDVSDTDETTATIIPPNDPPAKPSKPDGPTSGTPGEMYYYETVAIDPDGDQVWYWFEWGDDTNSGWVGPHASGGIGNVSHTWSEKGDYEITVKAKDEHDAESPWSDPLSVSMPKNKYVAHPLITQILERLMYQYPLLVKLLQCFPFFHTLLVF